MNFGSSSHANDHLHNLHDNLHNDENAMVEHQFKLNEIADNYAEYLEKKEIWFIEETGFSFPFVMICK